MSESTKPLSDETREAVAEGLAVLIQILMERRKGLLR